MTHCGLQHNGPSLATPQCTAVNILAIETTRTIIVTKSYHSVVASRNRGGAQSIRLNRISACSTVACVLLRNH